MVRGVWEVGWSPERGPTGVAGALGTDWSWSLLGGEGDSHWKFEGPEGLKSQGRSGCKGRAAEEEAAGEGVRGGLSG